MDSQSREKFLVGTSNRWRHFWLNLSIEVCSTKLNKFESEFFNSRRFYWWSVPFFKNRSVIWFLLWNKIRCRDFQTKTVNRNHPKLPGISYPDDLNTNMYGENSFRSSNRTSGIPSGNLNYHAAGVVGEARYATSATTDALFSIHIAK